jgi:NitT/TauT family transport system ATP-binding protein
MAFGQSTALALPSASGNPMIALEPFDAERESSVTIRAENVGVAYGTGKHSYCALSDCTITVEEGEILCLIGPSGCGKSTLLNVIAGFEHPSEGVVRVGDRTVRGPSRERIVCFQDAMQALFPWLDVRGNVRFALEMRAAEGDSADDYLALVGLTDHALKFPHQLSGGMRQRLQLARALAAKPRILLMDEPFGALDAMTRRQMHDVLLGLWEVTRKTIVFVTHDVVEAVTLADRIAIMSKGPSARVSEIVDVGYPRPRRMSMPGIDALIARVDR